MAHFREQAQNSRGRGVYRTQQTDACTTVTIGDAGAGNGGDGGQDGDGGPGQRQPPRLPVIGPLTLSNPRALATGAVVGGTTLALVLSD